MHKRMTITLKQEIYEGLHRKIGRKNISRFIEELVEPHVLDASLDDGYRAMAEDHEREAEAQEWCNALMKDILHEAR